MPIYAGGPWMSTIGQGAQGKGSGQGTPPCLDDGKQGPRTWFGDITGTAAADFNIAHGWLDPAEGLSGEAGLYHRFQPA